MKAHLLYRAADVDLEQKLAANEQALTQDLDLNTLFHAMAGGDEFMFNVARHVVLSGLTNDPDEIRYRQAVLADCLRYASVVQEMYNIAVESIESRQKQWWGFSSHHPGSILYGAVESMRMFVGTLGRLRRLAEEHAGTFDSEGFAALFALLKAELSEEYLATIRAHLEDLKFRDGILESAQLGKGNEGINYVLRKIPNEESGPIRRIFGRWSPGHTFRVDDRDQAGLRALSELRDQGINLVANALAQSADHILSFFVMLRTELAFYLVCTNLHRELARKNVPVSFPVPASAGSLRYSCVGLRDVCLALTLDRGVVGNDVDADGKKLAVITGANQGGKSTFLRSVGLAQLMMQCGMFVAAESFTADVCRGVFTHYKREEDRTMKSGKLDEELGRMSDIVDALRPDALLLFNESFAATNEREGSEIAGQIVRALLETRLKIFFVTHLYEFGHGLVGQKRDDTLFLRAERQTDGQRTFKVLPGEPMETSFGPDLYDEIFGVRGTGTPGGKSW